MDQAAGVVSREDTEQVSELAGVFSGESEQQVGDTESLDAKVLPEGKISLRRQGDFTKSQEIPGK